METLEKTIRIKENPDKLAAIESVLRHACELLEICRQGWLAMGMPDPAIEDLLIGPGMWSTLAKEHVYQTSAAKDLPLSKDMVLSNLVMPEGYRKAYAAFEALGKFRKKNQHLHDMFDSEFYRITDTGIDLVDGYRTKLEFLTGEYLTDPAQVYLFGQINQIKSQIEELQKAYPKIKIMGESGEYAVLRPSRFGNEVEINTDAIRSMRG